MKKGVFLSSIIIAFIIFQFLASVSAAGCFTSGICLSGENPILGISGLTNAHGQTAAEYQLNPYAYAICCDFGIGDYACSGNNKITGLSSPSNAHAEIPSETTYTEDVCYSSLSNCFPAPNCNGIGEVEVLSLSDNTNAHIGANYPVKICCQRACEMQTNNNTCLAFPGENCTWTPPGTTTNLEGGGCCGPQEKWNPTLSVCESGSASICTPQCTGGSCGTGYNDGDIVFWTLITQFFGVNVNTNPDPYNICTQVSSDLSYGLEYPVAPYNTLGLIKRLF